MTGNDVLFGDGQDDDLDRRLRRRLDLRRHRRRRHPRRRRPHLHQPQQHGEGEPLYGVAAIAAGDLNKVITAQNGIQFGHHQRYGAAQVHGRPDAGQPRPGRGDERHRLPAATRRRHHLRRPGQRRHPRRRGRRRDLGCGGARRGLHQQLRHQRHQAGQRRDPDSDYDHPFNPGNVLGYQTTGANATKFALYDAANGLRKILLTEHRRAGRERRRRVAAQLRLQRRAARHQVDRRTDHLLGSQHRRRRPHLRRPGQRLDRWRHRPRLDCGRLGRRPDERRRRADLNQRRNPPTPTRRTKT